MSEQREGQVDPGRFRHVLGHFPTGVVVVTAVQDSGEPAGMAVGSFTSVSLDPPLVAFLPDRSSTSFPKIRAAGSFCINVLAGDQEHVCRAFAARGADKYATVAWSAAGSGSPVLDGVVAWIDCDIDQVLEAGDHYIVLGRVRDLDVPQQASPLLFFRGGYGRFSPASLAAPAEPDLLAQLRVLDTARDEMERVATDLRLECLAVTVVRDEIVTIGSAGQAYGNGPTDRIGQRMPFVPPLCALFVAWAGPAAVKDWLAYLDPHMPEEDALRYMEMVATVRRRGWSIALTGRSHIAFELALAQLSVRAPTESQRQAVREAAVNLGHGSHEPPELLPRTPYRVRNISAPVFDESGDVVLMLTFIGLPKVLELSDIERHRDRLLAATDHVTRALGGRRPHAAYD
jgi:flavin reductase (DIM6/NTAB) family NADH-FMN oxidoreductase RutF/DNA-binding IclR family transcriptional regulator